MNFIEKEEENEEEEEYEDYSYEDYFNENNIPEYGCCIELNVNNSILNSIIQLADSASWEIPELKINQESFAHGGYFGSVKGLLKKVEKDIEMMKSGYSLQLQIKINEFLSQLRTLTNSHNANNNGDNNDNNNQQNSVHLYHILIRDPSGVSRVDVNNVNDANDANDMNDELNESSLQNIKYTYFERDFFENDSLGLIIDNTKYFTSNEQLKTPLDIAQLVLKSSNIVCLSGAGISVESGIPPFRDSNTSSSTTTTSTTNQTNNSVAIWNEFDPNKMTVQGFNSDPIIVKEWWKMKHSLLSRINSAQPNSAHLFFSYLQSINKLKTVITQNIDSLHTKSGVDAENIIELHGHMRGLICSNNSTSKFNPVPYRDGKCTYSINEESCIENNYFLMESCPPLCPECQSPLRTETVMFGQPIPTLDYNQAIKSISTCDLLFVIGSSLIVRPVKYLPLIAQKMGIPIILINRDETDYDNYATGLINQPAGEFLNEVNICLQELINQNELSSSSSTTTTTTR